MHVVRQDIRNISADRWKPTSRTSSHRTSRHRTIGQFEEEVSATEVQVMEEESAQKEEDSTQEEEPSSWTKEKIPSHL